MAYGIERDTRLARLQAEASTSWDQTPVGLLFTACDAHRGCHGRQDQVTQSIWFDPQRRAATLELQAVVTSLIASIEQHEATSRFVSGCEKRPTVAASISPSNASPAISQR